MAISTLSLTASAANLRRLATIRLILIMALLAGLQYVKYTTNSDLIHPTHLAILALFALVNMLTYWRLQQRWPVTDPEYFCQLLFDIGGLTVMLYASGGATNPFVSYYLVPITISAALLPRYYTWIIATLSLAAYTLMLFFYLPLPLLRPFQAVPTSVDITINPHILGMWLTFALSTVLISFFVVKMANALRRQEQQRASDREDELLDEQILAVATLAAGTAHELGTPLSTITVLLDELIVAHRRDPTLTDDLQLLQEQVKHCRRILAKLVSTAETRSHTEKQRVNVSRYLETVIDHWQLIRPRDPLAVNMDPQLNRYTMTVDPTLEQAIGNLLNNAADAADRSIAVDLRCDRQQLLIRVRDDGPGIPMAVAERMGKPFVSGKGKGLGLGLFLSHATINRYGGSIALYNHPEGGTVAELTLPISPEPLTATDNR